MRGVVDERELAALIERAPGRILLKPISETGTRSLVELAQEYRSYPLRFVWIYRDPVNVFDSMRRERWLAADEIDRWLAEGRGLGEARSGASFSHRGSGSRLTRTS
jgi:hypothetical protein